MAANRGLAVGRLHRVCSPPAPAGCARRWASPAPTHNGLDVTSATSPLQVRDDGCSVPEVLVTARIGIKHAVDWPLRFAVPGHICVSGARI